MMDMSKHKQEILKLSLEAFDPQTNQASLEITGNVAPGRKQNMLD